MRRVLCFGDSNTYGHSPVDGSRYGEDVRWPEVMGQLLGDTFEVINEGKNGRTVAFDDPYSEGCNGMNDIGPCLDANEPLDLVIIMLGTNDLKVYFDATPDAIAGHLGDMCRLIQERTDARILLASPMLLGDQIEFSPLHLEFGRMQVDYSFELAPHIEKVAKDVGAEFIDLAVVAMSSDVDCLHLMPEEHAKVAQAMKTKVYEIFKEELAQEAKEEEERQQAELKRIQEEEAARREEEAARQAEEAARQQEEAAKQQEEAAKQEEEAARQQEEAARQVEEAARQQAEAIFKAAEEEVAKEEKLFAQQAVESPKKPSSGLINATFVDTDLESAIAQEPSESLEDVLIQVRQTEEVLPSSVLSGSEKEKMLAGKLYRCDAELQKELGEARKWTSAYNQTMYGEDGKRQEILASLLGSMGQDVYVEPPFRCDYGRNISVGDNFYANFGCIMLDVAKIKIGDNVFFGPGVNVYTACHPIYAPVRNRLLEYAKEVTIGDDVWVGGNVTINPGVHIGNNVVIGSGSVVTGDIPDGVVAAGNPCRIIRRISDADKKYWEEKMLEHDNE